MSEQKILNRRKFIRGASALGASVPFMGLVGCNIDLSGSSDSKSTDTTSDTTADSTTRPEPPPGGGGGRNNGPAEEYGDYDIAEELLESSGWADGGTTSLTVDFPEDAIFDKDNSCTLSLTPSVTEGPCYFEVSTRQDISEGQTGLPMQLCLQVVDVNCVPISGLEVEVWHCDTVGVYSGNTGGSNDSGRFAGDFCTGGSTNAYQARWFRGTQVTDSSGRVNFKSCFPGWYASRTIHIHFRVRNGNNDQVISQLCFYDEFCEVICTNHVDYVARGSQDTPLSSGTDTVFNSAYDDYLLNLAKNSDGSLLAYKTLMISS